MPLFWHLYVFPSRATANAAQAPDISSSRRSAVWLFSIAAHDWHPSTGERVAIVGPLPPSAHKSYTARYLEGVIPPGERTPVHTHAGPETWYLVAGAECLETPEGITIAHSGDSGVFAAEITMILSRNAFALILHASAQFWTMVVNGEEWKPSGRCPK